MGQWTGVQTWPVEAIHTIAAADRQGPVLAVVAGKHRVVGPGDESVLHGRIARRRNHQPLLLGPRLAGRRSAVGGRRARRQLHRRRIGPTSTIRSPIRGPTLTPPSPTCRTWARTTPTTWRRRGKRWYPSATTLGNGDVLVLSGDVHRARATPIRSTQIYQAATNTWRNAPPEPCARPTTCCPSTRASFSRPTAAPSRSSDNSDDTEYLDLTGNGSWTYLSTRRSIATSHNYGPAVMYDVGQDRLHRRRPQPHQPHLAARSQRAEPRSGFTRRSTWRSRAGRTTPPFWPTARC